MIFQRVYTSRRPADVSKLCIERILGASSRNNDILEVSGLLLAEHGRFLQILEGPKFNVEIAFETISHDPRHEDIAIVLDREHHTRCFPRWSMGFREIDTIAHGENCFELTFQSVMNGPLAAADDAMRDVVATFLRDLQPTDRGGCEMFDPPVSTAA